MRFHCRLRTCQDAVAQAHGALRRYREAVAAGQVSMPPQGPAKLRIELPWPQPSTQDDAVRLLDEGAWPGGVVQRFRALRPCVEGLLDGYGASFVGMLEAEADGVGVWSTPDMTAVVNVTNATMRPFVDLAEGKYGQRVTQPGHFLLAINCQWTSSKDVGQLWDMQLRRRAAALVDDTAPPWKTLYALQPVYTSRGRCGIVYTAFPGRWQLFGVAEDYVAGGPVEAAGRELLSSDVEIQRSDIIDALRQQRSSS